MISDVILRLRSMFRRRVVERELDEELRFHLDELIDANLRAGMSRDDAVRRARLAFGGFDQVKEEHRDARGIGAIDDLMRDVGYGVRQLRRSPAFTLLAVLCLGLGIGVNTTIFSVLNAVLLRPMAGADADRLVMLSREPSGNFSYPAYRDYAARSQQLAAVTATLPLESDLDVDGESEFVAAETVATNYAEVLGVQPVVGRWFTNDSDPLVVISHAVWQRRFNRSPDVIGRQIRSESQTYTIVAVAPADFAGVFAPLRTDIWVPLRTRPTLAAHYEDATLFFMLFAKLKPGATALEAAAELNAIDRQLKVERASAEVTAPIVVEQVRGVPNPRNRRSAGAAATLLAVVVALVLLIACVNVGNLLLARGALRAREFAVRRALGATRRRVLQQLLTESFVLAAAGGICGVVLAWWSNRLLMRSVSTIGPGFAVQLNLSIDWRVLMFAFAITFVTTLLCGLLPAWRTSETRSIVPFAREIAVAGRRRRPVGVIAQVVMSLALLLVAGTFLQAVMRMQAADPGFAVNNRVFAYTFIPTPPFTPESGQQFYAQAADRLRALPGVQNAAITRFLPLMPTPSDCAAGPTGTAKVPVKTSVVGGNYFDTMDIALVSGRRFAPGDSRQSAPVVIVNESLAGQLWPNGQAVGEPITLGCRETRRAIVVGVVRNSAILALGERVQPQIFLPFTQHYAGGLTTLVLHTAGAPGTMVDAVRRTLRDSGQGIRVYAVQPLREHVDQSYRSIRLQTSLLTGFGALALALAAIGLYGVIAYRVAQRTQEIGVRMALGAGRRAVFREVVGQGLSIALVGVAIGETLAVALTIVLSSVQSDIRPPGFFVHAGTGLIWIAVAILATYLPAARAARVNPMVALRYE